MSNWPQRLAGWIRSARAVVAVTGAGVSTESGIPDHRGAGSSLWRSDDVLASVAGFRADPLAFYVGSSRVDLQACKLEYSIVSPK